MAHRPLRKFARSIVQANKFWISPTLSTVGRLNHSLEMKARRLLSLAPDVVEISVSPLGDKLQYPLRLYSAEGRDQCARALFKGGWPAYEHPLPALIHAALIVAPPGAWIDIGANTGIYSFLAMGTEPNRLGFAFEPFPAIADLLIKNVHINPYSSRLNIVQLAASDIQSVSPLYIPVQNHGLVETSASLSATFRESHSQVIEIRTVPIDEYQPLINVPVSVMKIDVEGAEDRVLIGAKRTIAANKPVIFCEILNGSGTWDRIRSIRTELSYEIGAIDRDQIRIGVAGPGSSFEIGDVDNFVLFPQGSRVVYDIASRAGIKVEG